MSSGTTRLRFFKLRSLNVRLASLFLLLFLLFSSVLFVLAYVLLESSLRREQDEELRSKLLQFWALYQVSGLDLLTEETFTDRLTAEWRFYLVRVADSANETLFLYVPAHWENFDADRLSALTATEGSERVKLESDREDTVIEVAGLNLHDGNVLQIGINIGSRLRALAGFRRAFLVVVAPLLTLGFAGGIIFANRSLKPISRLIGAIRSILATGKMNNRLPTRGTGDELDELVELFNTLLSKIDSLIQGMRASLDNVAHDLRTPLTRLSAKAQMALQSAAGGNADREALKKCIDESAAMLTMLNTLMDISEAETGAMKLARKRVDLAAIVADMAELYRYTAEENGLSIEVDVPGELQAPVDLTRIRQVFANLLDNAVKYTPAGGTIEVRVRRDGSEACISVRDTGPGIAQDDIENIWDRLYRSDKSRSTPGIGLGLSLVRAIVKAHDGTVSVVSKPGKGSVFSVTLPAGQ